MQDKERNILDNNTDKQTKRVSLFRQFFEVSAIFSIIYFIFT